MSNTPGIWITDSGIKLHADGKKGLLRQFPSTFPVGPFSPKGAWRLDTLAENAPWRVRIKPDQAITFARLAVDRARQAAEPQSVGNEVSLRRELFC